jgi:uncharacterized protein YndB with AHSA1/START domain
MFNIQISTIIHRPIGQVFEFVSTPENDFQWQYGILATTRLSEGSGTTGPFFRSIGHLMGRRILNTFEVTEFEPNRKYGFKSHSGPINLETSYSFETAGDGTAVNLATQAVAINFYQMDEGVLEKGMKKQVKENLALLKDLLEEGRIPPAYRQDPLGDNLIG